MEIPKNKKTEHQHNITVITVIHYR